VRGQTERRERDDDEEEREAVEDETARVADEREHGRSRTRPEDARQVELRGVEGYRVRQIAPRHERRDHRLIGRAAKRLPASRDERESEDEPDGGMTGEDQSGQGEGRKGLHILRAGEQPAAVVAIGDDPSNHHEQQDRKLAEEVVDAEIELRSGQVIDEESLGVFLHPGADRRAQRREPEQSEIPVGKGADYAGGPRAWLFDFGR